VARQTTILLTDDLDGGEASETVRFGVDGVDHEIDLSTANAARLREDLVPFVTAARRVGRLGTTRGMTHVVTDHDPAALRAWARAHGVDVSARGRIPDDVVARYRAAGN